MILPVQGNTAIREKIVKYNQTWGELEESKRMAVGARKLFVKNAACQLISICGDLTAAHHADQQFVIAFNHNCEEIIGEATTIGADKLPLGVDKTPLNLALRPLSLPRTSPSPELRRRLDEIMGDARRPDPITKDLPGSPARLSLKLIKYGLFIGGGALGGAAGYYKAGEKATKVAKLMWTAGGAAVGAGVGAAVGPTA